MLQNQSRYHEREGLEMKERAVWSIYFIASFVLTIAGGIGCAIATVALFKAVPAEDPVITAVEIAGGLFTALLGLGFVIAFIVLIMFLVSVYRDADREVSYADGN